MPRDRNRWIALAALGLAVISLGVNAFLIWHLRQPERWALPAVRRVVDRLVREDASIEYEVRLPAGTPLRLDIPVDERFSIRVDTVIPINTTVRLPIESPLGDYSVRVPVRANVPLRTTLPLDVEHTFRLRTRTDEEIVIPIEIRVRDLPLEELLDSEPSSP